MWANQMNNHIFNALFFDHCLSLNMLSRRRKKHPIAPIKRIANGSNNCFKIAAMQYVFSMTEVLTSLCNKISHHESSDAPLATIMSNHWGSNFKD